MNRVLCLIAFVSAVALASQGSTATGVIQGQVTGLEGGDSATVDIVGLNFTYHQTATTSGVWSFNNLARGAYRIKARAAGYTIAPASVMRKVGSGGGPGVTFTATKRVPPSQKQKGPYKRI